jgi:hypothetical protein
MAQYEQQGEACRNIILVKKNVPETWESRLLEITEVLSRIFEHAENGEVDKAVRACLRVSRYIKDYFHTALFLQELNDDRKVTLRVFLDDTSHLKKEAQTYLYDKSLKDWIASRTLPYSFGKDETYGDDKTVLNIAVGEIPAELEQWKRSVPS